MIKFSDDYRVVTLPYFARLDLGREARAKLKEAGFKSTYYYRMDQLGLAKAMAARILKATGVRMEVTVGFSMSF